jgi:hypothetical protein
MTSKTHILDPKIFLVHRLLLDRGFDEAASCVEEKWEDLVIDYESADIVTTLTDNEGVERLYMSFSRVRR